MKENSQPQAHRTLWTSFCADKPRHQKSYQLAQTNMQTIHKQIINPLINILTALIKESSKSMNHIIL